METNTLELTTTNPLPKFLKTLCILSFIMCGLMLLFGLMGLKNLFMSAEDIMAMNPYMQKMQDNNPESYQAILDSMQYKNISAIMGFLVPLISLTGVIYMWKMKKTGFYIYLIGEVLPYLVVYLTSGLSVMYASTSMMGDKGEMIINIFLGSVVLFDIVFIILYALNLKHMK